MITKQQIGECLLACIHTHKYEGGFDNENESYYKQDRLVFETVCDMFDLDKQECLKDYGYKVAE